MLGAIPFEVVDAVLNVTHPSVIVNSILSKLDTPLAACLSLAVPVGADALVVDRFNNNLLCKISALVLTSASKITLGLIWASTVFAVESISRAISPTTVALIASAPSPVNTKISLAYKSPPLKFWKLSKVKLCRLTASNGLTGLPTLTILLLSRSILAFIAN